MSQIVVRRQHRLGVPEARRLAETMASRLQRRHGGTFGWTGNRLSFSRRGASGHVAIADDSVEVLVDLGLLLRPLRGRIEREVQTFLDELEAPAAQAARPAARRSTSTRSSRSQGASTSVRPK